MKTRTIYWFSLSWVLLILTSNANAQNWPFVTGNHDRSHFVDLELHPPFQVVKTFELDGNCGGITYYDQILYSSVRGAESWIKAFDSESADLLWTFKIPGGKGSVNFVPAVSDSIVLAGGQGTTRLYGLNRFTGDSLWSVPVPNSYTRNPIIDHNQIYIISDTLYCFDLKTGQTIWNHASDRDNAAPAVIDEQNAYYIEKDSIKALNKLNGEIVWKTKALSRDYPSLTYNAHSIFTASHENLIALDRKDGSMIWSYDFDSLWVIDNVGGGIALADTILLVKHYLPPDGPYYYSALHTEDGHFIWTKSIPDKTYQSPTILKDIFIDAHFTERALFTYNLFTGDLIDRFDLGFMRGAEPIVADGIIYIGVDKSIYALDQVSTTRQIHSSLPAIEVFLYPNPAADQLFLNIESSFNESGFLEIRDLTGQPILQSELRILSNGSHFYPLFIGELPSGVYVATIRFQDQVFSKKLVKQ